MNDPSPAHLPLADLPDADERELLAAEGSLPEVEDLAPEIEEALENGLDEPYVTLAEDAVEGEGAVFAGRNPPYCVTRETALCIGTAPHAPSSRG